jgi:hypothetical protein
VTDRDGNRFPTEFKLPADETVVVDRQRPEIELKRSNANDELMVDWKIVEKNPDVSSLDLQYRLGGKWQHLDVEPALKGHRALKPGSTAVRLRINDLAGNETTGLVDPLP